MSAKQVDSGSNTVIDLKFSEVFTELAGVKCLPNTEVEVRISAKTRTEEFLIEYEQKTWNLSFATTILTVIATYFTIAELKKVAESLEQLQESGQTENHARRLSLLTNCLICIWNMCYSITFFVTSMYFKVSLRMFTLCVQPPCSFCFPTY